MSISCYLYLYVLEVESYSSRYGSLLAGRQDLQSLGSTEDRGYFSRRVPLSTLVLLCARVHFVTTSTL